MIAAVITLSVTLLTAIGALVFLGKHALNERERADNAHDLYQAQLTVKHELELDRAELTRKLSATDEQLREAKAKIVRVEIALNKALEREQKQTAERISRAPNPLDELTAVMHERSEAVPETASTDRSGSDASDSLLIETLE